MVSQMMSEQEIGQLFQEIDNLNEYFETELEKDEIWLNLLDQDIERNRTDLIKFNQEQEKIKQKIEEVTLRLAKLDARIEMFNKLYKG